MKKIKILALLMLTGLMLGGCVKKKQVPESNGGKITVSEEENGLFSGSLRDLVLKGKPVKCAYEVKNENGSASGITYVSGKKVRGDFKNIGTDGEEIESYFVSDGEWTYTWSSEGSNGMKMKAEGWDKNEEEVDDTGADYGGMSYEDSNNIDTKMDYKCEEWRTDDSIFEVPSDIEFKDMNAEIEKAQESAKSMCGTCDMITDEDGRLECRESLGCDE
ncbi:hypothetical protein KKA02_03055 [Patescibacteria group bacterium]|nr:hypothetical protein [Patescibacteria group bacterium]